MLAGLDLDESPGAPPINEQLRDALARHAGKVLDLFREWDEDGDGQIDKGEFREAMTMLVLEVRSRRQSRSQSRSLAPVT